MTFLSAFEEMLSRIEPTIIQKRAIQRTRDTIDQVLQSNPKIVLVKESFLTGSYKRNTLIRPIEDIDLYVVVNFGVHADGKKPIFILREMAKALRNRYTDRTGIRVDSPCVVIKFSDYKFEVVPAVYYIDDEERYMVPGPGAREWVDCYPNIPHKWLTTSNYTNDKKFVPLIKILKQWNRHNGAGLKSFHLELLTGKVFDQLSQIASYPQAIYDWMYYVNEWIHYNNSPFILEPGKNYTYVDDYLYQDVGKLCRLRRKLKIGLKRSETALDRWIRGKEGSAKMIWKQMFGRMFPSPLPIATGRRLIPPKPPPLGQLIPPKPLPMLGQTPLSNLLTPPKPSPLGMALREDPKASLNSLMNRPISEQPKYVRNALLDLLSGSKKFPRDE
jgi:hypothetical protein